MLFSIYTLFLINKLYIIIHIIFMKINKYMIENIKNKIIKKSN